MDKTINPAFFLNRFLEIDLLPDLKENVLRGIREFQVSAYRCDVHNLENSIFPLHWHDELQFARAISSPLLIDINGQNIVLEPGEAVFINSRVLHSISALNSNSCFCEEIIFNTSVICEEHSSPIYKKYIKPLIKCRELSHTIMTDRDEWGRKALRLFDETFKALSVQPFGFEIEVRSGLGALIEMLTEQYYDLTCSSSDITEMRENRVRTMVEHIYKNFSKPLSVSDIAASASVSERECYRDFASILNTTPNEFLRKHRISVARIFLEDTDQDIAAIAYRCGFSDQAYFSRAFRSIVSCTPGKYRKKCRS